jgi:hypothetical protein
MVICRQESKAINSTQVSKTETLVMLILTSYISFFIHREQIIFKDSFRTAKKTQHFTITKINWLTLF